MVRCFVTGTYQLEELLTRFSYFAGLEVKTVPVQYSNKEVSLLWTRDIRKR